MHKVLITGASGFVGRALCKRLVTDGWHVRGTVRSAAKLELLPPGVDAVKVENIGPNTDWTKALSGVDMVVHLAARVHVMKDSASNPFSEYQKTNVMGSEQLARSAAGYGVQRFIFLSSVKVNGEETLKPYKEGDAPAPKDFYGISKMQAEKRINEITDSSAMDHVILRPPLVYGPGVKANFFELMKIIDRRMPLPLASIQNRRSLVYLENLVDAILTCMKHPDAVGQTYLASDAEAVSTTDLIRNIATALNRPPRLFYFPGVLLFIIGRIIGKGPFVDRLIGSLTVDITKITQELGWRPPFSMEYGLQKTAEWYRESKNKTSDCSMAS